MTDQFQICRLGHQPVVVFAADELARYLSIMTRKPVSARYTTAFADEAKVLYVGELEDFEAGLSLPCEASAWDDALVLKTFGKALALSGSNPRSVLFAVYRYLEFCGARWLWPGDGELLPRLNTIKTVGFDITERASLRHRGVCVEGAVSLEHNLGFIDWMAKKRMNAFHMHFDTLYVNYNSYYSWQHGPGVLPTRAVSPEEAQHLDDQIVEQVKKRGLILERGGHNWTGGALGIEGFDLQAEGDEVVGEKTALLALVDGKRDFFKGSMYNTELCYSNPRAFDMLVNHVVQYAADHPEVDVVHFWLADHVSNLCECADCQKLSPSDWYVQLVNAIADRMTQSGCNNKLVFLAYNNTRWAPTAKRIENRDGNVVFMFAPYPGCYVHALTDYECAESYPLERPKRNEERQPRANRAYREFLKAWQTWFVADSFLFYYHLWIADILTCDLAAIIRQDVREVSALGLSGVLSAQPLPVFAPTGIPMAVLAATTWNTQVELSAVIDDYLASAFGDDASFVGEYLERLQSCMAAKDPYAHDDIPKELPEVELALKSMEEALPALESIASSRRKNPGKKAIAYLLRHNRYATFLLRALRDYVKGNKSGAAAGVTQAVEFLHDTEEESFWAMDLHSTSHKLGQLKMKYAE
jgi:hypothetical protein